MPRMFDQGFDRKLTSPKSNHEETLRFISNKPKPLTLPNYVVPHGYRLLESKTELTAEGDNRVISLIADLGDKVYETVYKVRVLVRETPNEYISKRNATQLLVWRSVMPNHRAALNGFAREMFLYILSMYDILITDREQTPEGRRFWEGRIADSLEIDGHYVYYLDLDDLTADLIPHVKEISSYQSFVDDYVDIAWGNKEEHADRAFLISIGKINK